MRKAKRSPIRKVSCERRRPDRLRFYSFGSGLNWPSVHPADRFEALSILGLDSSSDPQRDDARFCGPTVIFRLPQTTKSGL